MWQERLILPGYETRERYHPAGSPPYLMCNSKKLKGNQGGGKGSNPNQGNQNQGFGNRGNQNQGNQNYQNRNQGNPGPGGNQGGGRGYQGKNPRGGKYNPPQGDYNASAGSTNQQGIYDYDVDSSDITDIQHSVSCVTASVIPAIFPDEFLHDPSTLPSDHLNVTVFVQDKDKERQSSVRRTVGKAVLDTANYSEDFVSFTMIDKLSARHNCYAAPTAITVCSGLDGQCDINNELIDLSLIFHSYDGECHTILLTLRVNRNTDIDLLLSRKTVNKYDFMSLTPFAFGISPELSAENKRKRDARWLEFEEREAIAKLDPLHWHKYTRRMISEGFVTEEPEVESITLTYDMLKGITKAKISDRREPYGLCPRPTPKKATSVSLTVQLMCE